MKMKHPKYPRQVSFDLNDQANRIYNYGIIIGNLITYLILWLLPINGINPVEDFWITYPPIIFMMLVLYWDFSRLGRMIARSGQGEKPSE